MDERPANYWRRRAGTYARWAIGLGVLTVASFVLGRSVAAWLGADVASFDAGMLATVLGIVVGAPIAILVTMELTRRDSETDESEREAARRELLVVIARDLRDTRDELVRRSPRTRHVAPFLGTGLWDATKAFASTQIGDPELLREITRAYDRVAVTGELERMGWEAHFNPADSLSVHPPRPRPSNVLLSKTQGLDSSTKAALDVAIDMLAERGFVPEPEPADSDGLAES